MSALRTLGVVLACAGVAGVTGCAAAMPPPELVTARSVYDRAAHGPAAQVNPTDLHTAKESLDAAEKSFAEEGDTQETRDLGYTAERRTETAEARARTMLAMTQKEAVVSQMHASTVAQAQSASTQLGHANREIAAQGAALQTEVQRRQDAEKRAAAALATLAKLSSVKQEPRGMVITLSGSVLFTSGKADLLSGAQVKLNEVAQALTEQNPDSKMIVEGHTDSQGSAASNQDLSQRRAQSVRDYLVSRGIAADRITAQGVGPTRPIADNASAEGRANNRRVEIIIQPTP